MTRAFYFLLLTLTVQGFGPKVLAPLWRDQPRAEKAWGYVLDHAAAAVIAVLAMGLLSLVGKLAEAQGLNPRKYAAPMMSLLLWCFVERAQGAGCRVLFAMDKPPPAVGPMQGLCDVATGLPIYLGTALAVLAWSFWHMWTTHRR